jgi:hypothetical protein
VKDKENTVRKLMMYSTYLAVLAMVSMGHAQAACGGGGYKTAGKTTPATPVPKETVSAPAVDAIYYSLDSTRFDSVSATLELSKGQAQQVANAVSDINEKGAKLAKAQTNAQSKLDHCNGNCESELRNLARATAELKSYDSTTEFDLRLRGILRPNQAATYFHS